MAKKSARKSSAARPQATSLLDRMQGTLTGYLNRDPETNIVEAILKDHDSLKTLLKILKDEDESVARKRVAFDQFRDLLKSHSDAEEKALYTLSSHLRDLKLKTEEGFVEHDVALDLLNKIKRPGKGGNTLHWQAQIQVLAELVEHHLKEEENDLLPRLRRKLNTKTQARSSKLFIKLRRGSQNIRAKRSAGVLK